MSSKQFDPEKEAQYWLDRMKKRYGSRKNIQVRNLKDGQGKFMFDAEYVDSNVEVAIYVESP